MLPDAVTTIGRSLIQHGPANDRVYLMKLAPDDMPGLVERMLRLGRDKGYSKLFARVQGSQAPAFAARGFADEALVPGLYRGREDGHFMSRFLDGGRAALKDREPLAKALRIARAKAESDAPDPAPREIAPLGPEHAPALAGLYKTVFKTYPFSISDPGYLREAMASGTMFFGLERGGRITAAASAEVDADWLCAEMTDFATLPEERGRGAAGKLLARMEERTTALGLVSAYTIARAESPGMNAVFARAGYDLGGTLMNNTQISGKLESMNVWYKRLIPQPPSPG
ncbi:putative beta-lysine N-acetyltransferase [Desulfocurvus sp. DL9XJH121]